MSLEKRGQASTLGQTKGPGRLISTRMEGGMGMNGREPET